MHSVHIGKNSKVNKGQMGGTEHFFSLCHSIRNIQGIAEQIVSSFLV
jgi:hypothetical protein